MTTVPMAPSTGGGAAHRLRWALADTGTLTRRELTHWARHPAPVLVTLAFPIMLVLMFGYLFGGAMAVPGGGNYREFLMPGMFAMTMVFGLESTMQAVGADAARGVTDRFRSLPMASSAVLCGRAVADLLHALVTLAVMVGAGLAVGWRPHGGVGATVAALALLMLLRFALLWVGIFLGLTIRGPNAVGVVQVLEWPLGFLANAFVAPATMPGVLRTVAEWNPLSATVSATRQLFGNPGWGGESWAAAHALPLAVVWPLLLTAVFAPLAVRRWRRLAR